MKYSNAMIKDNTVVEIDARNIGTDALNLEIATKGSPGSNKFGFGFTGPQDFARRECGGPILSGPYLYGFGLCSVIHNGPITGNPTRLFLRTGDIIAVRDLVARGHLRTFYFEATVDGRGYINFECIGAMESKGQRRDYEIDVTLTEIDKDEYSEYRANNPRA